MKKKLISLLVCFSMLLSVSPAFAYTYIDPDASYYQAIEAESDAAEINGFFEVKEDERASGGAVMQATLGNTSDPPADEKASLTYHINVPEEGAYNIYMRYGIFEFNSESIYHRVNGAGYQKLYESQKDEYQWKCISKAKLQKGDNTLDFRVRKAGFRIDKIVVTNAMGYYPIGMGDNEPTNPWETKDYNEEQNLFNSIAMPSYVPQGRPRLTVTEKDIPTVKSNLTHPQNEASYRAILTAADYDASECDLPPVTTKGANNYNSRGLAYIESNAFLYLVNGDVERGRKAIDGSFRFLSTMDINNLSGEQRSRQGNFALYIVAQTYDWCYSLLTPEERKELIALGMRQVQNSEYGWPPSTAETVYASGHLVEADFMKNLLAFGIAIYDEYPDVYNIVAGWVFSEFIPTKNYFYNNSILHHQGQNYSGFRFTFEAYMTVLLDKCGAGGLVSPKQDEYLYGSLLTRMPDGSMLKLGDSNHTPGEYTRGHKPGLFLAANHFKDPFLKQEYFKCTQGIGETVWNNIGVTPVDYLLLNDTSLEPDSMKKFPLTTYMGDHVGAMSARTSWAEGKNANAMVAFMSMPEKFFKGHQHYDSGEFQIYYKGMLALKSGNYSIFGNAHDYGYQKQSIASNCMLIRNPDNDAYYSGGYPLMGGQALNIKNYDFVKSFEDLQGEKTTIGKILGYDYGPDPYEPSYSYLKGDITAAYNGNAKDYTRSFVFLNFFDEVYPGALIVFDKVSSNPQFKKTWLLHSQEEPEINGNTTIIRRTENGYNGRLVNETLLPRQKDAELTKIGGEGAEYWVNDKNLPQGSNTGETGLWRIELSPKAAAETNYFLNVLQVGDNAQNADPLVSTLLENESYFGVQIRDRVAWLNKDKSRGTADVTIGTAEGSEGTFTIMVDGLYPGTWSIQKDGQSIGTAEAAENSGALCFTAEAGEYTLVYQSMKKNAKNFEVKQINPDANPGVYLCYKSRYYDLSTPVLQEDGKIYVPVQDFSSLIETECTKTEDGGYALAMGTEKASLSAQDLVQRYNTDYTTLDPFEEGLHLEYQYYSYANLLNIIKHEYVTITGDQIKNSSNPSRIPVIRVQSESGDPTPVVDGNLNTSWVVEGEHLEMIFEFEQSETIKDIKAYWRQGNLRKIYYEVQTSEDGKNYTTVCDSGSSGSTEGLETVGGTPCKGKFVKLVMKGNSQNNWNGIHEVEFYR